jgi:hypothetical protein
MQAAMAEEERKRQVALDRQGAEKGETKWVLSVREQKKEAEGILRVTTAGLGEIDELGDDESEDDSEDETQGGKRELARGRIRFGKVSRLVKRE